MGVLSVVLIVIFCLSGCEYEHIDNAKSCPEGFINWEDDCIVETIIINSTECPEGYAITSIGDSVTCTAGLGVHLINTGDIMR